MKEKNKSPNKYIITSTLIIVFIFFIINIFRIYNVKGPSIFDSDFGNKLDLEFDIYEDGIFIAKSKLPYILQTSVKNKKIELISTLPSDDNINKSFISFKVSGYSVIVNLDNKEIYNSYQEDAKEYGGGYWHFIRLPENSSSKQMKISLYTPINNPFAKHLYPIFTGNKGYLLTNAFSQNYRSLFFGIILISFGLVFLGNLLIFNRKIGSPFFLSLSLLLLCLGSWVFFQSNSKQLLNIINPALPMELSLLSMFLFPYTLWFYTKINYKKINSYKILKYFSFGILFLYIPISITSFLGISYLHFLSFIGSLILLFVIILFSISIKIYINGEKSIFSCIIALLSILISVLAEEVLLIFNVSIGKVSLLHTGMAIAAIIFIYRSIGNLIEVNKEDNKAKLLEKLAYLDVVTLVENRNSYERFIEDEQSNINSIGIILADINCLKIINDVNGHKVGDEVLKTFSQILKKEFPKDSRIFRIGGDEFIGIIKSQSKDSFINFSKNLQKKLLPNEDNFGMALGYHFYIKENDKSLENAIVKADKDMYKNKESQKQFIKEKLLNNDLYNILYKSKLRF